jgi:pSer/pThr/pTyr-binding forkhead associated (FHA) protein
MPILTLKLKNKSLGEYQLQKGVSLPIGRRETNDVVIEDPAVSGHHAKIDALGDRFVLIDLQSKKRKPDGVLIYLHGGSGQVELKREITTIGKDPSSDIVVKGLLIDPTAVTISKKPDGFYLNYIGGLSKPKVNDTTVKKSIILNDLDIIEIGSARLQFSVETR